MTIVWWKAIPFLLALIAWAIWSTKPKKYEFDLTSIEDPEDLLVELESLQSAVYETTPVVLIDQNILMTGDLTALDLVKRFYKLDLEWVNMEQRK